MRLNPFFCWLILIGLFCNTCQRPPQSLVDARADAPVQITILQINDVYEIAPLEGGKVGGLARVAGLLRQLEAENPNTLAVLAGDFFSPSFMGNLKYQGERIAGLQMVETLNALGLDCATFGNHEFDLKTLDMVEARLAASTFKYCSANARAVEGTTIRPFLQGDQPVEDFEVFSFPSASGNEIRLALVGIVLPFNKQAYVHYEDVQMAFAEAVQRADQEAELVLGLTHLSIAGDIALAKAVPGLPLFMGGHDHNQMSRYVGRTAITKADANAKTVYVHRITYYPSTDVATINSEVLPINGDTPVDEATAAVVSKWESRVDTLISTMGYDGKAILMTTAEPLLATEQAIRGEQTNYGRLANEAFRWAWPEADVYVFNSGSLRIDDDLSGTITAYDVLRSFPYGGPLVRMTLPGEVLQRMLDIGEKNNRNEGGYLQRLQAELVNDVWTIKGKPIAAEQAYVVVLPEFVAKGREANLEFLTDYTYLTEESLGQDDIRNDIRDVVMAYMKTL